MIELTTRRILNLFGYTLNKRVPNDPDKLSFQHFLELFIINQPTRPSFIQLGAHDGIHRDPIHELVVRYNLPGVVVEPQPDVFARLKENYAAHTNIVPLNVAVGSKKGRTNFYTVKDSHKKSDNYELVTAISSFKKERVLQSVRNKIPKGANPEDYIQKNIVTTEPLSWITATYGYPDIYQIDCEGYDWEIIKQIDFTKNPKIINFESGHLSPEDKEAYQALFTNHGYHWFNHGIDTCAYKI